MNITSPPHEILWQAVQHCRGTLGNDMQRQTIGERGHQITDEECRQRSILGFPLKSTYNFHIGRPGAISDKNCNKGDYVYRGRDQRIA